MSFSIIFQLTSKKFAFAMKILIDRGNSSVGAAFSVEKTSCMKLNSAYLYFTIFGIKIFNIFSFFFFFLLRYLANFIKK